MNRIEILSYGALATVLLFVWFVLYDINDDIIFGAVAGAANVIVWLILQANNTKGVR